MKECGFSSVSSFAIEIVADLEPMLVGLKVIVKVVELPGAIGEPVKFKSAEPRFSIVNVIIVL